MRRIVNERVRKTSLRKNRLKTFWFRHASMFGTYLTQCTVEKDHGDGTLTISYYDQWVDEWYEMEIEKNRVRFE